MVNVTSLQQKPLYLVVLSAVLLFAAWPMSPLTFFIFIAFVPLLLLSNMALSKWKYFGLLYLTLLIWNLSTTWWVYNASAVGGLGAFFVNSLLMCIPWLLYRRVKRQLSTPWAYVAMVAFWLCFEFGHLHDWGLSWPWLTVGNVFANQTWAIQWYSITGTSGGTLWVFVVNIFIYELLKNKKNSYLKFGTIALIIVPLIVSYVLGAFASQYDAKAYYRAPNIVIVQPNIDSWTKLESLSAAQQLQILINTSKQQIDSNTTLLLWPETALYSRYAYEEDKLKMNNDLAPLWDFLAQYPKLQLLSGIESVQQFEQPNANTRTVPNTNYHYEAYNAAVLLDSSGPKQFYHKSMLVPGAETLPWFLQFLAAQFSDFGGTTNGYTRNEGRTPIATSSNLTLAPSICYESIYGGFMSRYKNNGANIIAIITNDGWWRNTPGHKQHFAYAKLRAIENRCFVIRSANTGISGVIDPTGKTIIELGYNQNGAVKAWVTSLKQKTFYNKFPDILYWLGVFATPLLFVFSLFRKKKSNNSNFKKN